MSSSDTNIDSASLEATFEGFDGAVSLLSSSKLAESFPVFGTAIKILRGVDDIRNSIFAAKLLKFVSHPSLQNSDVRAQMRRKIEEEPDEANRVGATLLMVLEKLTDLAKPTWLAKVFAAYLAGTINASALRRHACAIDLGFGDDLLSLIQCDIAADNQHQPWMRPLLHSGLTEFNARGPNVGGVVYQISDLGKQFRKIVRGA